MLACRFCGARLYWDALVFGMMHVTRFAGIPRCPGRPNTQWIEIDMPLDHFQVMGGPS
jgi:hypothetical protein